MKTLYVPLTPYHVLLSATIGISDHADDENHMLIRPGFGDAEILIDNLSRWEQYPFDYEQFLPSVVDRGKIRKRTVKRTGAKKMMRFLGQNEVDRVYVFDDVGPVSQAALHFGRKYHDADTFFVEDGIDAYSTNEVSDLYFKQPNTVLEKIFYGPTWFRRLPFEREWVSGASDRVRNVRATFPDLVRPELERQPVQGISNEPLVGMEEYGWLDRYFRANDADPENLESIRAMFAFAHSTDATPEYNQLAEEAIEWFETEDISYGVKYHPLEDDHGFIQTGSNAITVSSTIPAELLYVRYADQLEYLLGRVSTAQMTAKWLCDDITVLSLKPGISSVDTKVVETFDALDIPLISSVNELTAEFQKRDASVT